MDNTTSSSAPAMLYHAQDFRIALQSHYTPEQAAQRRIASQRRMHEQAVKSSCAKWFAYYAERHGVMLE